MLAGGATKIHKKGKTGFSACKDAANSNFCGLNMIGPGCCSILNSGLVRVDEDVELSAPPALCLPGCYFVPALIIMH